MPCPLVAGAMSQFYIMESQLPEVFNLLLYLFKRHALSA
jgi:hypothetical protein